VTRPLGRSRPGGDGGCREAAPCPRPDRVRVAALQRHRDALADATDEECPRPSLSTSRVSSLPPPSGTTASGSSTGCLALATSRMSLAASLPMRPYFSIATGWTFLLDLVPRRVLGDLCVPVRPWAHGIARAQPPIVLVQMAADKKKNGPTRELLLGGRRETPQSCCLQMPHACCGKKEVPTPAVVRRCTPRSPPAPVPPPKNTAGAPHAAGAKETGLHGSLCRSL
jgi:hypothetical protein